MVSFKAVATIATSMLYLSSLGGCLAADAASQNPMPLVLQAEQQSVPDMLAKGGKQAFVYNPTLLSGGQQQTGVKSFGAAGSSSSRMARQFPALAGFGIAQTLFTLAPCAQRAPHTHPRGSGLLYAISATALEIGFALEDASGAVINNVTTGASALFPLGLLHYQQNRDCKASAVYTISYNADDPGTVNQAQALFALPAETIAGALNATTQQAESLAASIPTTNIYPGAIGTSDSCVAACKAQGIIVPTMDSADSSVPLTAAAASAVIVQQKNSSANDASILRTVYPIAAVAVAVAAAAATSCIA